jgi:hypothetical protein
MTHCATPECPRPAVTERRTGNHLVGDGYQGIYKDYCRGCASDHDDEVRLRGWSR